MVDEKRMGWRRWGATGGSGNARTAEGEEEQGLAQILSILDTRHYYSLTNQSRVPAPVCSYLFLTVIPVVVHSLKASISPPTRPQCCLHPAPSVRALAAPPLELLWPAETPPPPATTTTSTTTMPTTPPMKVILRSIPPAGHLRIQSAIFLGFGTPFWRNVVLAGFGVAAFYKWAPAPGEDVYLTRWIAMYSESRDHWLDLNAKHTVLSQEASDQSLLFRDAKQPTVHRLRYPQWDFMYQLVDAAG